MAKNEKGARATNSGALRFSGICDEGILIFRELGALVAGGGQVHNFGDLWSPAQQLKIVQSLQKETQTFK